MKLTTPRIAIGSGIVLLLLGSIVQIFGPTVARLENNFVTLQFYRDHPGISIMLVGAAIVLIGSLLDNRNPTDTSIW